MNTVSHILSNWQHAARRDGWTEDAIEEALPHVMALIQQHLDRDTPPSHILALVNREFGHPASLALELRQARSPLTHLMESMNSSHVLSALFGAALCAAVILVWPQAEPERGVPHPGGLTMTVHPDEFGNFVVLTARDSRLPPPITSATVGSAIRRAEVAVNAFYMALDENDQEMLALAVDQSGRSYSDLSRLLGYKVTSREDVVASFDKGHTEISLVTAALYAHEFSGPRGEGILSGGRGGSVDAKYYLAAFDQTLKELRACADKGTCSPRNVD
ncbi:MAG: hypothetical protein JJ896_02750 [Rhodothermales bacterium]|nr:hypothetical protein [Rhodothermales bacterium]MBO6778550.1 hypothetical protein [Rhodothermales bacterium]